MISLPLWLEMTQKPEFLENLGIEFKGIEFTEKNLKIKFLEF
jgi:hypothetical protein